MSGRKRVLFTGGSGFVGRNVVPVLAERFEVIAPRRDELDLLDADSVARFVEARAVDAIVHSANPNPVKNAACDRADSMVEDSLRQFFNVVRQRGDVEQVLYFGSGAEYDKRGEVSLAKECEIGRSVPADGYGFAKYVENELARGTANVTNLRLFACFGPFDHSSKFITHCIRCVLDGSPVTVRQDCLFDYLHVSDVARTVAFFLENPPQQRDYNLASGSPRLLSDIAVQVVRLMGADAPVEILAPGMNREYTADVSRLASETGLVESFLPLEEGIRMQIEFERSCSR